MCCLMSLWMALRSGLATACGRCNTRMVTLHLHQPQALQQPRLRQFRQLTCSKLQLLLLSQELWARFLVHKHRLSQLRWMLGTCLMV